MPRPGIRSVHASASALALASLSSPDTPSGGKLVRGRTPSWTLHFRSRAPIRGRSEGDRRRTYLRLRPEALATLTPAPLAGVGRVVFVCTHNSARSQLAAALWSDRTHTSAASARTKPAERVHPRAVAVAHRHGLQLNPTGTAHVAGIVRDDDLLIAVCDNAHEELAGPVRPRLHWSVPDPVRVDTDTAFEAAFADPAARIDGTGCPVTPVRPGSSNGCEQLITEKFCVPVRLYPLTAPEVRGASLTFWCSQRVHGSQDRRRDNPARSRHCCTWRCRSAGRRGASRSPSTVGSWTAGGSPYRSENDTCSASMTSTDG
ncbi:arsenate-mycothiol transferase ArsC [Micromonospora sp. ZYX-F-536]|uniref:arsenate-mycothiol transferase ArsC n=1 Tax=Micromonospora sp. ZYX-F-536 TaxID=3457629 RepID=UPI00404091FF